MAGTAVHENYEWTGRSSRVRFARDAHGRTMEDLHAEIEKLQSHCRELNFKMVVGASDKQKGYGVKAARNLSDQICELTAECRKWKAQSEQSETELALLRRKTSEEMAVVQTRVNNREEQINTLEKELDKRADTIALLTHKLRTTRLEHRQQFEERSTTRESKATPHLSATETQRSSSPNMSPSDPTSDTISLELTPSSPTPQPPPTPRATPTADFRRRRIQKSLSASSVLSSTLVSPPRARLLATSQNTVAFSEPRPRRTTGALSERVATSNVNCPLTGLPFMEPLPSSEEMVKPLPAVLPPIQSGNPPPTGIPQAETERRHRRRQRLTSVKDSSLLTSVPQPVLRAAFTGPRLPTCGKRPAVLAARRSNGQSSGTQSALDFYSPRPPTVKSVRCENMDKGNRS